MRGAAKVKLDLEASTRTLKKPFRPRSVKLNGRSLKRGKAWTYNRKTGVLRVKTTLKPGRTLTVTPRAR